MSTIQWRSYHCRIDDFYVSSSAWNLYDLFVDFMALNDLPAGPLFLQDYGLGRDELVVQSYPSMSEAYRIAALNELNRVD